MKYSLECFGLRVTSDIDLLSPCALFGNADLDIRLCWSHREVGPANDAQWGREAAASLSWAILPGLARLEAHDNGDIVIEAKYGVDMDSLRSLVVTTALPLALQVFPGLLLEASMVRWRDQGLLILGRGYCGKSTLAALMADLGADLLADSHCLVCLDEKGEASVAPGPPHVRLWPEQAGLLGAEWPAPRLLRPHLDKLLFVVPERFASYPVPIKGLILLRRGVDEKFTQRRLGLVECLQALSRAGDRLRTVVNPDQTALRFELMSRLASFSVCHLVQWPRRGRHELETRSRVLDILEANAWEATV